MLVKLPACSLGINTKGLSGEVTFSGHVAPLLQKYCISCHSVGGQAPFPLQTYEQVAARSGSIASAVAERRMPPWSANDKDGCAPLEYSLYLEQSEVTVFTDFKKMRLQGEAIQPLVPPPSPFNMSNPDAVVSLPPTYTPTFPNGDEFRCFILDFETPTPVNVIAVDILPTSGDAEDLGKNQVHHVILSRFATDASVEEARIIDDLDPAPGFDCSAGAGAAQLVGTTYAVWTPGNANPYLPEGTGIPTSGNLPLFASVHISNGSNPPGTTYPMGFDIPMVYTLDPVAPLLQGLARGGGATGFIPPGPYTTTGTRVVTQAEAILQMNPHMHMIGEESKIVVERAGQPDECVTDVKGWDFDWQRKYTLQDPIVLSPGDAIRATCKFFNPYLFNVLFGEETGNEMCLGIYNRIILP